MRINADNLKHLERACFGHCAFPRRRATRARGGAMQFLESAASALNKVDALAAEVIPPRRPGVDDEAGEDVLETDPGAVSTASTVEALASRLGLGRGDAGEGRDGGAAMRPGEDARGPRDGSGADPLVTSQRMKLAGLLSTLRAAESAAAEAKAARDDALASAAEARARREREASDAAETLAGIEREIEAERNALEAIETESRRRERDAGAADGDASAFDAALAEAEALAASRLADAQAREARAGELKAEADALEKAAEERKREWERTAAEPAESPPPPPASAAARRAETDRLRDALASAESELSALETRLLSEASRHVTHAGHVPASNTADAAELERRLRDVTDRLEAKRAETTTLAGERRELERVVAEALMERRRKEREFRRLENGEIDDDDDDAERVTETQTQTEGALSTEKESARAVKGGLTRRAREKQKRTAGLGVFVASAARRVDALGVRAGRRLRRSGGWRSAALLYALGLHVFAFLVLALRALGGGPELKPVEGVEHRRSA